MKRQVRYLCVSASMLMLMVQGRLRITNIPEDAAYLRCQYDFLRDALMVVIEHPSFDVVDEGAEPPMLWAEVEIVDDVELEAVNG